MVDMTAAHQTAVASIEEDIEHLTAALTLVSEVRLKLVHNDSLEQMIKLLGGEIAWLQSKRAEADMYLNH